MDRVSTLDTATFLIRNNPIFTLDIYTSQNAPIADIIFLSWKPQNMKYEIGFELRQEILSLTHQEFMNWFFTSIPYIDLIHVGGKFSEDWKIDQGENCIFFGKTINF